MTGFESEALAQRLAELADSKGATEIVVLDMRGLASYTDFLAICTARNERQARAIVDEVKLRLKQEHGLLPGGIDGEGAAGWIVLDYLDVVLHVFTAEERERYQLDGTSGGRRHGPSCSFRRMASEGASTVPRMGSFKRALLGYRRDEVDAAIVVRDARIGALEQDASAAIEAVADADAEAASLSAMVIEREREIRGIAERLREANERHDRSIASLHAISARLEEIQVQARGQATRIRMKALREAVEVSRRTQELADVHEGSANGFEQPGHNGAEAALGELFEGLIKLEIGPLGDFSQLVGFENAVGRLGASEISVERFSEGRATLSMRLDEPVDLLRELEENAPFDFNIRRTADDNLILDVDEDQDPGQRAA